MTQDNQNNQKLESIKENTLKEAEKIWREGRRKIRAEIDSKTKKYKSGSYQFQMGNLQDQLIAPLDDSYKTAKAKIEETPDEKTDKFTQIKEDMRKEIDFGYSNAIAFLNEMTREEASATYDAAAKMMIMAPKLTEMARNGKCKELTEMFSEMVVITVVGDKQEKALEKAILDEDSADIAFFMLNMMRISAREDFTIKFIKKHPEKTVWLMEEGNKRGCYTPTQMKQFFEIASVQHKDAASTEKLKNFQSDEKFYEERYTALENCVNKRSKGLMINDDGNPVLKAFTFEGAARGIGYMSSILTIAANLAANREKYWNEPSLMTQNLYLMGAAGALVYLTASSGEKKVAELFTPKSERERVERLVGLSRMNEMLSLNTRWSEFLEEGGVEMMSLYEAELKKNPTFIEKIPDVKDLLAFCEKNEEKRGVPPAKRGSRHLAELLKKSPDQAQKDTIKFMEIFESLRIENQKDFRTAKSEAKTNLS